MQQFTDGFGAISRFHIRPVLFTLGLLLALAFAGNALGATPTPVPLGNAGLFAVLAGSGITNEGVSTITGDVGSSPTHSETGLDPCPISVNCVNLTGTNHNNPDPNDAVTQQAKTDLTTAYNNAAGQSAATVDTELGGHTYTAGVYKSDAGTFGMTGTLTLDGGGNPGGADAIFIFQTASTLITAESGKSQLSSAAAACNVFWKVGSATLGAALLRHHPGEIPASRCSEGVTVSEVGCWPASRQAARAR